MDTPVLEQEKKKYRPSQFNTSVKVKRVQHAWLKENKDCKTIAGFLDKIINFYKTNGNQMSKMSDE